MNQNLELLKEHILNSGYQTPQQSNYPYIEVVLKNDQDNQNNKEKTKNTNKYRKLNSVLKYKTNQTYNC